MKAYLITTKNDSRIVPAKNRAQAFAKYFLEVRRGNISLDQLGHVVILRDPDNYEEYPFRVVPTIWLLGLISEETAIENIALILDTDRERAKQLLHKCAEEDKHVLEEMNQIETFSGEAPKEADMWRPLFCPRRYVKNPDEWCSKECPYVSSCALNYAIHLDDIEDGQHGT